MKVLRGRERERLYIAYKFIIVIMQRNGIPLSASSAAQEDIQNKVCNMVFY